MRIFLRERLHYGWVVVAIAFVTMALVITARSSFSLLYPEVLAEFGWERGATAAAYSLGFAASTAMLPVVGFMMGRWGPRLVIPVGAVMISAGFALCTQIDSLAGFYIAMGLLAVNGTMATSYIVHSMFIPNWFSASRGLAVGVAFSGVGIGGVLLFPVLQDVIDTHGWRTACLVISAAILLIVLPLNAIFQRNAPKATGPAQTGPRDAPELIVDRAWAETEWTVARAAATSRFWLVFIAFACGLFCWYGIQAHQTKFLIDKGFEPAFAAQALGLVALCGIAGQIGIGALSDRLGREVAWTLALLGFAATAILLLMIDASPSIPLVYAMIAVQGLLGNGLSTLFGAVITEIFSGPRLASIFAMITLGGNLGAGAGAWALGDVFDRTGDYTLGFWICLALTGVSILFIWLAAPRKVRLVAGRAVKRG